MIIDALNCMPDGTQTVEKQEVSDDYFVFLKPKSTLEERVTAVETDVADLTAAVEKGLSL